MIQKFPPLWLIQNIKMSWNYSEETLTFLFFCTFTRFLVSSHTIRNSYILNILCWISDFSILQIKNYSDQLDWTSFNPKARWVQTGLKVSKLFKGKSIQWSKNHVKKDIKKLNKNLTDSLSKSQQKHPKNCQKIVETIIKTMIQNTIQTIVERT